MYTRSLRSCIASCGRAVVRFLTACAVCQRCASRTRSFLLHASYVYDCFVLSRREREQLQVPALGQIPTTVDATYSAWIYDDTRPGRLLYLSGYGA